MEKVREADADGVDLGIRNKLKRIVQVICKPLHKLRFDEIETEHVIAVLRKVWHQREISRDTRQRIKKILDAAIALNLRPKHNPADCDSLLKPIMPKQRKRGTVRGNQPGPTERRIDIAGPLVQLRLAALHELERGARSAV